MPQVRIRNVSKEYKMAAGLFVPGLLDLEEQGPYSRVQRYDGEGTIPQT